METDTPAPTDRLRLNNQLCFALYSTLLGINKLYRGLLRDIGLTYPQYLVMLVLWERDGINVSTICEKLYLETTTLTPLLKRLETQGLIIRQRSAADERQVIVSLTDDGRAMRDKAAGIPECVGAAMEQPPEALAALRGQLKTLRDALFRNA